MAEGTLEVRGRADYDEMKKMGLNWGFLEYELKFSFIMFLFGCESPPTAN